ncbi:ankyrin repeat domain-containing protein 16-like [Cervus elaphus]|uniref:ankyrin repeat domain-containing protein 16-like n=1 Tax=Cervus canadensis TaxID=1574408 RepID=UPI001C9E8185|nr:ankyrin repeat domain-containing protein 16-like [Cervus canadensis]XP_043739702.1 ankyrin repeat domain-containing protein 16-like [Cervus elaphus]
MRGAVRDWARGLRGACPRYPPAHVTRHSRWDILAYLVDTWDLDIEAVNQDYKRALSARGCLHGTSGLRAVPAGPGGRRKQPDQAHLSMTAGKKLTHSLQRLM